MSGQEKWEKEREREGRDSEQTGLTKENGGKKGVLKKEKTRKVGSVRQIYTAVTMFLNYYYCRRAAARVECVCVALATATIITTARL